MKNFEKQIRHFYVEENAEKYISHYNAAPQHIKDFLDADPEIETWWFYSCRNGHQKEVHHYVAYIRGDKMARYDTTSGKWVLKKYNKAQAKQ